MVTRGDYWSVSNRKTKSSKGRCPHLDMAADTRGWCRGWDDDEVVGDGLKNECNEI